MALAQAIIIDDLNYTASNLRPTDYPKSNITSTTTLTLINEVLPFRVRFTTIGIVGYSPSNFPGIGLQVIGLSNYII
jgi:hypothetical protein